MAEPEFDFRGLERQVRPFPGTRRIMGLYALVSRPEQAAMGNHWTANSEFRGIPVEDIHKRLGQERFGGLMPRVGEKVAGVRLPDLLCPGEMGAVVVKGPPTRISWRSEGVEASVADPHKWAQFSCFVLKYDEVQVGVSEEDEDEPDIGVVTGEVEIGVRLRGRPDGQLPGMDFYRCDQILLAGDVIAETDAVLYSGLNTTDFDAYIRLMRALRQEAKDIVQGSKPADILERKEGPIE